MPTDQTPALSIRQPWAWLIIHAGKDIENRNWPTRYRGPLLIHAAKGMTREEYQSVHLFLQHFKLMDLAQFPSFESLERGGIIGQVTVTGCVDKSASPWFFGNYGFTLADPRPLPFRPCLGRLGFFKPE